MLNLITRIRNWLFTKPVAYEPEPIVIEASEVWPPKRKHKKHVHLSKRKKAMLASRYRQGETIRNLAFEFNVSYPTARRIVAQDREQRAYGKAWKRQINGHASEGHQ